MNELLGFIVLSGPLFWVLIFFLLAIVFAVVFMKKVTGAWKKLFTFVSVLGIVFIILFGDEIIGSMYLEYLCENKVEMKVYNTVKLPAKYWDEDGSPKFINARGVLNTKMLGKRFEWNLKYEPYINIVINIKKSHWIFKNKITNQVLGEKVDFVRDFGWLNQFSPSPNGAEGCRNVFIKKYGKEKYFKVSANNKTEFLHKIFMKSSLLNKDK